VKHRNVLDWLMQTGGPIIRYRTATELLEQDPGLTSSLRDDLLSSSLVEGWLKQVCYTPSKKTIHGAHSSTFENFAGKLYEFGIRAGEQTLDEQVSPYISWLANQLDKPNEGYFPVLHKTITACFLAMLGYEEKHVNKHIINRLDIVHDFAIKGDLGNIYIPRKIHGSFPKTLKDRLLINPELYPDDEFKLPWIYDVNAFLHSKAVMNNQTHKNKVEDIISFILTPQYQHLKIGYGVVRRPKDKYYVMGWSVHLPGYFSEPQEESIGYLLLLLDTFRRSTTARDHDWFQSALRTLGRYRSVQGFYTFPRQTLPEKKIGCWILGHRMALEAKRRTRESISVESTFRVLNLLKDFTVPD